MSLQLDPRDLDEIDRLLREHVTAPTRVWVFGSRANGKAKPFSDLDLALDASAPLTDGLAETLKLAFVDSDLPIKIDVIDLHAIDHGFRQRIEADLLAWPAR